MWWGLCMKFTKNLVPASMSIAIKRGLRCSWKKVAFRSNVNCRFILPIMARKCRPCTA